MADRESISRWLASARYRMVHDTVFGIVQRLVAEGRAEWCGSRDHRNQTLPLAKITDKGRDAIAKSFEASG